ncbi:hypothetical protein JAAARDRAFT_534969 [Jaapia argillacea MUCL 33604]|uniref:F-box domain-containing protein n=1 Tax=Jaapia argillacea MUCL 33604 TaxID=933084 RepID=A0A067PJJ9_9AGAM|nr:hypothetical protein JAAARDRAFT_534969 [Jaapia argillacea MUCL 33604]
MGDTTDAKAASLPPELLQRILHYLLTGCLDLHQSPDWLPQAYHHPASSQTPFPRDPIYKPIGPSRAPLLSLTLVNKHWSIAAIRVLYDYVSVGSHEKSLALAETLRNSPSLAHLVRALDFAYQGPSKGARDGVLEIIPACPNVQHVRLGTSSIPTSSRCSYLTALGDCTRIRTFCLRGETNYGSLIIRRRAPPLFNFEDLVDLMGRWPDFQNLYLYPGSIVAKSPSTSNGVAWTLPSNLPRVKGLVLVASTDLKLFQKALSVTNSLEQLSLNITYPGQVYEIAPILVSSHGTMRHLDITVQCLGKPELPAAFYTALPNLPNLLYLRLSDTFFPVHRLKHSLPPKIGFLSILIYQDDYKALAEELRRRRDWLPSLRHLEIHGPFPKRWRNSDPFDVDAIDRVKRYCRRRKCHLEIID